jgi:hypothetical protein
MYGLLKVQKPDFPLRPIVTSIGSPGYKTVVHVEKSVHLESPKLLLYIYIYIYMWQFYEKYVKNADIYQQLCYCVLLVLREHSSFCFTCL